MNGALRIASLLLLLSLPARAGEELGGRQFPGPGPALAGLLGEAGLPASAAPAAPGPEAVLPDWRRPGPPDDLKPAVLFHLDGLIALCRRDRADCEAGGLLEFARGLGGLACAAGSDSCVRGILETCRTRLAAGEVSPARYMTCAAMLGRLGERDCAEGRAACAGDLQGTLYFSLRAAAGCVKSFEKDPRRAEAERLAAAFGKEVNRDVRSVYVGEVQAASTVKRQLAWFAAGAAGDAVQDKVLEAAFERLSWRVAGELWDAAGWPFMAYEGIMLARDIAASELNNMVCLDWAPRYGGGYAGAAGSLRRMTAGIR